MQEHALEQLWWRNLSEHIALDPLHDATRDSHTSDLGSIWGSKTQNLSPFIQKHFTQIEKLPGFGPLQNLPSGKSAKSGPLLTCTCGVKNVLVPSPGVGALVVTGRGSV